MSFPVWIAVFAATVFLAGLVQGVAGFGSGPIQMMAYPHYWPLPAAAAVSVCVSVPLNLNMLLTYRREVRWKKVLLPIVPYMAICSAGISFSTLVNQALMKKIFGVFLILLALYYLYGKHGEKKFTLPKTVAYVLLSALCDAFFGIGGPLMVLYYLNRTDSSKEYLGTIAAFFLVNGVYNSIYRAASGILTAAHLPFIGIGIAGILAGVTVAHRLAGRLKDANLKKITYVMIGVSGVINLFA